MLPTVKAAVVSLRPFTMRALTSGSTIDATTFRLSRTAFRFERSGWISTGKHTDEVPDEFFNVEMEKDKEFLDLASIASSGRLENLTTMKDQMTWQDVEDSASSPIDFSSLANSLDGDVNNGNIMDENAEDHLTDVVSKAFTNPDVAAHLKEFGSTVYLPEQMLDYNVSWRKNHEVEEALEPFIPDSSKDKFRYDMQGMRACSGKLQRRGKNPDLNCHLIDLDALNHMDVFTLRRFLSDDSEILGRRSTGLCAKCQRKVAKTVKRARHFGLLPHLGDYNVEDTRPFHENRPYHDTVGAEQSIQSKTVL